MDGVVAGGADHQGFAAPFHHELCPCGLCRSGWAEVGEFSDVVNRDVAVVPADLAPAPKQPLRQLFASIGDPFRGAVGC
jgi:hypothetical protein